MTTEVPPRGWPPGPRDSITDIAGIRAGHWTDRRGLTGCTVVLCETSTVAAVDVRGGAPGTRETAVLAAENLVRRCHAVLLTGGSAFGLAAATGVMRYLRERGVGFETTAGRVPIVSAAVLYDLSLGRADAFPDEEAGYLAARRATRRKLADGSVGAGTGATVAKVLGAETCLKGGVATASVAGPRGLLVGAVVATNAFGAIVNPASGELVAGPRKEDGGFFGVEDAVERRPPKEPPGGENTTLVCVATNAALDSRQTQRLAIHAHDGLARTIFPVHTLGDGDVAFAVAMGKVAIGPEDTLALGVMTVRAVERAVLRSVAKAEGRGGVPSAAQWALRIR